MNTNNTSISLGAPNITSSIISFITPSSTLLSTIAPVATNQEDTPTGQDNSFIIGLGIVIASVLGISTLISCCVLYKDRKSKRNRQNWDLNMMFDNNWRR